MNCKTHIVIPIGVANPGTPVPHLLRNSIQSIKNQTDQNFLITVASDDNISEECKEILKELDVNVEWYEPGYYFKRGGIWKKISECWKKYDSEYICFMHYDDQWHEGKLKAQVDAMDNENLTSTWSKTFVINDKSEIVSGDVAFFDTLGRKEISCAFAHSLIIRRKPFMECGIMEYEDRWAPVFESLYAAYVHRMGNGRKVHEAIFYWRNHTMNMTNTIFMPSSPEISYDTSEAFFSDKKELEDKEYTGKQMDEDRIFLQNIINSL